MIAVHWEMQKQPDRNCGCKSNLPKKKSKFYLITQLIALNNKKELLYNKQQARHQGCNNKHKLPSQKRRITLNSLWDNIAAEKYMAASEH